jgi:NAD(P)-dependent dehydrogenase (short-subunit alcohol dehydrogenase family)
MSAWIDLTGQRALVTGGSKGVGSAIVSALRAAGASVMTSAGSRPDNLPEGVPFHAADLLTGEAAAPSQMRSWKRSGASTFWSMCLADRARRVAALWR